MKVIDSAQKTLKQQALKKILVVEDVRSLSRAIELKLNREGFQVKTVPDGSFGIEAMQNEHFDLVILDLIMPMVDGFKVLQAMREAGMDIPVIVLTNLSQIEDEQRATDLGAAEFFVKSNVSVASLVSHIKALLTNDDQLTENLPIAA